MPGVRDWSVSNECAFSQCHLEQKGLITDFFFRTALGKPVLGGEQAVLTGVRDIPEWRDNKKGFHWRRKLVLPTGCSAPEARFDNTAELSSDSEVESNDYWPLASSIYVSIY